eukprot:859942-Amphidinium_carterae.1
MRVHYGDEELSDFTITVVHEFLEAALVGVVVMRPIVFRCLTKAGNVSSLGKKRNPRSASL